MPFELFDLSQLRIKPLKERIHDLTVEDVMSLDEVVPQFESKNLVDIADRIVKARENKAPVIMLMGAHVLRKGNANFIIDLMRKKIITHLGMNGAVAIHDYEMARIGATTESVSRYISEGQFGLWKETGEMNDIFSEYLSDKNIGFGEALGCFISRSNFPYKHISIVGNAYQLNLPLTVHVAFGQDILHEHPNFNGAAVGKMSYIDFLIFAHSVQSLENGVFLNYGTAVMGPEVFLKALAMARNVANQKGESITRFCTAVFDIRNLPNYPSEELSHYKEEYYFRPYKTVLERTVKDGGESFYIKGDHKLTLPNLYKLIIKRIN